MKSIKLVPYVVAGLIFSAQTYAETKVEGDELKALITGKTLEGRLVMWESNYRVYLAPSGDFVRVYGRGDSFDNRETGTWKVNKKGKLCFEIQQRSCRRVKKRDDGGYNLYNKQKELKQTIEKITEGNPYNLKE